MCKRILAAAVVLLLLLLGTSIARADEPDLGFNWNNHAAPFTFKFNNLIDNHQQTRLLDNGRLHGFIYVQFTGEMIDGIPVARRANCDDPTLDCRLGWEVIGLPLQGARLVQKRPRLWRFDEGSLPADLEFGHFHWTGSPKKPCGLVIEDVSYSGYLFKRTAVTTFYWLGGNPEKENGRLVTPGLDLHSNLEGRWTAEGMHDGDHTGEDPGGCDSHDSGGDTTCDGHDSGSDMGGCEGH